MSLDAWALLVVVAAAVATVIVILVVRARRQLRDRAALVDARGKALHVPPTLHPKIDPELCIGSLSCLSVCPEGDILGLVDGRAALINAAACIGHAKCALECPVDAIRLVVGSAERGMDLPEVDEYFETTRSGVHVVGELGGMGLIKNAIVQGLQVGAHLGERLKGKDASKGRVGVVVVGAGPAGLATALALKKAQASFRLLEQDAFGGMVAHYPRQKLVMSERVDLPFLGRLDSTLISKEELLAAWERAAKKAGLQVETRVKVTGIKGQDEDFFVETSSGTVRSRKVVLATGRGGSPRKLGVPGENLPKVSYHLVDPAQYDDARVLVVGGGDSAMEAASQLADESTAQVALAYRGEALGRGREANKRKLLERVEAKRIALMLSTEVKEILEEEARLEVAGRATTMANDFVLVCIGGELPAAFLSQVGVGMRRYFGTALGQEPQPTTFRAQPGSAKERVEKRKTRHLAWVLGAVGVLLVAVLWTVGWDYYPRGLDERRLHQLHAWLRPAGAWGHGVGVVATLFMLSNFFYVVRKRWRWLKGAKTIRRWLTFHQFVGLLSAATIFFHAAFQSNNLLATLTTVALLLVVATGLVGRFLWGRLPTARGRVEELESVVRRWERLAARVEPLLSGVRAPERVRALLTRATEPGLGALGTLLGGLSVRALRVRRQLNGVRPFFPRAAHFREFRRAFLRVERLRLQVSAYRSLRLVMASWRVLHVSAAVTLVLLITAHISLTVFLGFRWLF